MDPDSWMDSQASQLFGEKSWDGPLLRVQNSGKVCSGGSALLGMCLFCTLSTRQEATFSGCNFESQKKETFEVLLRRKVFLVSGVAPEHPES